MTTNAMTLKVDNNGLIKMGNLDDQMAYARHLIASKILPTAYTSPEKVVAAMQLAAEMGLKPGIKALTRIAVINGTPALFAEGPLAVVQSSGQLEAFEGYYVDDSGERISVANKNLKRTPWGYVFKVKRKGQEGWYEDSYNLDQSKRAGLGNVWNKHSEDMLRWRTIAKVLKVAFADVLAGAQVAEYDQNTYVSGNGGTVEGGLTDTQDSDLNDRFEETKKKEPPVIEDAVVVLPPLPGDTDERSALASYVIPMGAHAGKKLEEVALDALLAMIPKINEYRDKQDMGTSTYTDADNLSKNATRWLELQERF